MIETIYGARWLSAADSLSLLGVLGLLRVFYELAYDGLAAAERKQTLLVVQGLWLVVLVPVLLAGARLDGITGVSAGHVLVAVLVVGPASSGRCTASASRCAPCWPAACARSSAAS